MKSKILFLGTMLIAICSSYTSHAQQWDGPANTLNGISRWGHVGIGTSSIAYIPNYPLHIIANNPTSIKLVNSAGGELSNVGIDFQTYNPTSNWDHRVARIAAVPYPNYNAALAFYTRSSNTGGGTDVTERMRILHDGKVGIGTSSPVKLLHLKEASPVMLLEASSGSPGIEFSTTTTAVYNITYTTSTAGGQLKIGPTNGAYKSLFLRPSGSSGVLVFSHNPLFGHTGNSGLSGSYLFDAQVSACSLMVAPAAASGSYPTMPSGHLFNVQGSSYFNGLVHVNNTSDLDPTSTTGNGIMMGNSTNTLAGPPVIAPYSWIQTDKLRPLALNPMPDNNPINTSYVAIGFIPGQFNVPLNYKLAVKGRIICEELKVKFAGLWSDYVFEKNYKLLKLKEVEKYIVENKHLPDVPSEAEVKENGFETGQMNATLLRKIEELTLYMIEMDNRIEQLEQENKFLKTKKQMVNDL